MDGPAMFKGLPFTCDHRREIVIFKWPIERHAKSAERGANGKAAKKSILATIHSEKKTTTKKEKRVVNL